MPACLQVKRLDRRWMILSFSFPCFQHRLPECTEVKAVCLDHLYVRWCCLRETSKDEQSCRGKQLNSLLSGQYQRAATWKLCSAFTISLRPFHPLVGARVVPVSAPKAGGLQLYHSWGYEPKGRQPGVPQCHQRHPRTLVGLRSAPHRADRWNKRAWKKTQRVMFFFSEDRAWLLPLVLGSFKHLRPNPKCHDSALCESTRSHP